MQDHPPTLCVILAGGLSRRMGGGDKGLVRVAGKPVLAHLRERLMPQVVTLALNANGDPGRFSALGLTVLADGVAGNPGPLAGILAALDHGASIDGIDWVVSVPCDTPFVPVDLVARLHAGRGDAPGAVATSAGRRHPTVALWSVSSRIAIRTALVAEGIRRVEEVAGRLRFAEVEWPDLPFDPFLNLNRPADIDAAEAILAGWPDAGASLSTPRPKC
jgi:molybdopterin-guanine dinucleotide biosynthesis protein A